jgi:hypothetical protein
MKTKTKSITEKFSRLANTESDWLPSPVKVATVMLSRAEAAALVSAVSIALDANGGDAPRLVAAPLAAAVGRIDGVFQFGLAAAPKPIRAKCRPVTELVSGRKPRKTRG